MTQARRTKARNEANEGVQIFAPTWMNYLDDDFTIDKLYENGHLPYIVKPGDVLLFAQDPNTPNMRTGSKKGYDFTAREAGLHEIYLQRRCEYSVRCLKTRFMDTEAIKLWASNGKTGAKSLPSQTAAAHDNFALFRDHLTKGIRNTLKKEVKKGNVSKEDADSMREDFDKKLLSGLHYKLDSVVTLNFKTMFLCEWKPASSNEKSKNTVPDEHNGRMRLTRVSFIPSIKRGDGLKSVHKVDFQQRYDAAGKLFNAHCILKKETVSIDKRGCPFRAGKPK